jgi:hypothetical protein
MSTVDLVALNDRLQQLDDRQAVGDLITRLGRMLDERLYDEARTIVADDVTVHTPGGFARGAAAVVEQAKRNHTVRTQHVITDVLVDVRGNRAHARANLIVTFVPDSDQPDSRLMIGGVEQAQSRLMIGERYDFDAVRGDAGWRLASIEVVRLWSTLELPTGAVVTQGNRDATPDAA